MKPKGVEKILVTGGAGFIGSHVVDILVAASYEITVLDTLEEQVHGKTKTKPDYLNPKARFILGSISDRKLLDEIIPQADAVIHLAAVVGVGQSMYQIHRYMDSNTTGTAMLLDTIVNTKNSVRKVIVASSMSIYGEGKYYCKSCSLTAYPPPRTIEQLQARIWDHTCPNCSGPLSHQLTDERTPPAPTSIYAMSKLHQEDTALLIGKTYGIPTVGLRFFNVYGPRQALSNPYTGVCAIFSSRILNRKPPYVFEDGGQLRDFVHVKDVARGVTLSLEKNRADNLPVNIASGRVISILELAKELLQIYDVKMEPHISEGFRKGDVRHCYADVTRAKELLGFEPKIKLEDGLVELAEWGKAHGWGAVDLFDKSLEELKEKQLT